MALGILVVALVKTSEEYHAVGVLCLLYGLGYQLVGRAGVVQLLLGYHAVVLAGGVADVSACVLNLYLVAQILAHALEGKGLALNFQ